MEQHPSSPMLEVTMRPRVTVDMSYVGDCDSIMCTSECIKLLYVLFILAS